MKATAPLSAADLLQVGSWFRRQDRLFEITAWDAAHPLHVEARAADTDERRQFTLTELFASEPLTQFAATLAELVDTSASDVPARSQAADAATLAVHLLQRADRIILTVEAVQASVHQALQCAQANAQTAPLAKLTRQACQALLAPVTLSTYYAIVRLIRPTAATW